MLTIRFRFGERYSGVNTPVYLLRFAIFFPPIMGRNARQKRRKNNMTIAVIIGSILAYVALGG
jgi:hypothetical protein